MLLSLRMRAPDAKRVANLLWVLVIVITMSFGLAKNGLLSGPLVLADEYGYRAVAAAMRSGDWTGVEQTGYRELPNRLYFAFYGDAARAPDGFAAARMINLAWVLVGLFILSAVARASGAVAAGALAALAYGLGPISTYTAYFMPEPMFAVVLMAACASMARAARGGAVWAALTAGMLAALTFVKPHGWAIVGALATWMLWLLPRPRSGRWRLAAAAVLSFAFAYLALRSTLPARPVPTATFGFYAWVPELVRSQLSSPTKIMLFAAVAAVNLLVMCCAMGPAIAYGIHAALRPAPAPISEREATARSVCAIATVAMLGLILMAAAFIASVNSQGPTEIVRALHSRFYAFTGPLVLIGFLGSPVIREWSARSVRIVGFAWLGCSALLAIFVSGQLWSFGDAPDLFIEGLAPKWTLPAFGIFGAALVLLWPSLQALKRTVLATGVLSAVLAGLVVHGFHIAIANPPEDHAGRFVAAVATHTGIPVAIVSDPAAQEVWTFRIASHAPWLMRIMKAEDFRQATWNAGVVAVWSDAYPPGIMVEPLATFGTVHVGRLPAPMR